MVVRAFLIQDTDYYAIISWLNFPIFKFKIHLTLKISLMQGCMLFLIQCIIDAGMHLLFCNSGYHECRDTLNGFNSGYHQCSDVFVFEFQTKLMQECIIVLIQDPINGGMHF